jgi:hypothetical protein
MLNYRQKIPDWLNNPVASATLYTPGELLFGAKGINLFQKCLPNLPKGETKQRNTGENCKSL